MTKEMNSFELFKELKKTEAGRAAKPGDVAPHDIIVEKHDTGMVRQLYIRAMQCKLICVDSTNIRDFMAN